MGEDIIMTELEKECGLELYESHKKVLAVKIRAIVKKDAIGDGNFKEEMEDGDILAVPENRKGFGSYSPFILSEEYVKKHNPQVGGYYVQYKDGYQSWSPAEAFESGYTLVEESNV